MGRAGWGILTMTMIALAVAIAGAIAGNNIENMVRQNPTLDQLYGSGDLGGDASSRFDSVFYGYVEGEDDISTSGEDYYQSSWSNTRTVIRFLRDFVTPTRILGTIPALQSYPEKIIIWVINAVWIILYGLLLFEVIWRFNIFD